MIRKIKSILNKLYIKLHEHTHEDRLKYLFQNCHSDTLIIGFSGFLDKSMYNYVRTLHNIKADKMFILDDFAYKGSYYWYEKGRDYPNSLDNSLILSKLKCRGA